MNRIIQRGILSLLEDLRDELLTKSEVAGSRVGDKKDDPIAVAHYCAEKVAYAKAATRVAVLMSEIKAEFEKDV